jgi:hypothetical protein
MALMAARGEIAPMPDCAIFADTGWEPKAVYEWLAWLKTQLPFPVYHVSLGNIKDDLLGTTNSTGQRFTTIPTYTMDAKGNRGMSRRQCTREYKIDPIVKKIRELLGLKKGERAARDVQVVQWIGISWDEMQRMKISGHKYIEHRWPLIEKQMSRRHCLQWMAERQYPKPAKSACLGCPYSTNAQWRNLKDNSPEEWAETVAVDKAIRNGSPKQQARPEKVRSKLYLHKDCVPLDEADLSTPEERGQYSFLDECDGMCGV